MVAAPAESRAAHADGRIVGEGADGRVDLERVVTRQPLPRVQVGAAVTNDQDVLGRVRDVPRGDSDDGDQRDDRADVRGVARGSRLGEQRTARDDQACEHDDAEDQQRNDQANYERRPTVCARGSLDDLVGAGEKRGRDINTKLLRCLAIDNQVKLRRLPRKPRR